MNRYLNETRPLEPNNASEAPEEWADIVDWEASRADYFESELKEAKAKALKWAAKLPISVNKEIINEMLELGGE